MPSRQEKTSLRILELLRELEQQQALATGDRRAAQQWLATVSSVCVEDGYVVCIANGEPAPPEHLWLIDYLNGKLHGPDWREDFPGPRVERPAPPPSPVAEIDSDVPRWAMDDPPPVLNPHPHLTVPQMIGFQLPSKEKKGAQDEINFFVDALTLIIHKDAPTGTITSAQIMDRMKKAPKRRMPPREIWSWLLRYFGQRWNEGASGIKTDVNRHGQREWWVMQQNHKYYRDDLEYHGREWWK